ncbi:MAG TPA: TRAP transporter large permease [Virgibacillus sp.]|nr:TRAP transporter large permease [Virgibacillus sp.]
MQVLFILLFIFFLIGVPIAIVLGFSSLVTLEIKDMPLVTLAQKTFEGMDSFTLLAIPFFILAGTVMTTGGISRRLMDFANALVGWIRGGLGAVAILTSMLFATMSGSSSATTAAIGPTLIPAMEKKGYPKNIAAATCGTSGELGSIIPPSIAMIVFGATANVSIGSLFLAGIVPGLLIGLSLILTIVIIARVKKFDSVQTTTVKEWSSNVWRTFKDAFFALLMPVIILGGIYSGWFTPTEAAAIAAVYGIVVSMFVYKEINLRDLFKLLSKSAVSSAIILLIVSFAAIFGYVLTIEQIPHQLGELIASVTDSPIIFLLLVNILLLIVGMFLESYAAIIILVPILFPIATSFGIDPIHFGMVVVVNIALGMITPPLAVNLYLVCQIADLRIEQIIRPVAIFFSVLIVDLLIITYIPFLSTWLPSILQ